MIILIGILILQSYCAKGAENSHECNANSSDSSFLPELRWRHSSHLFLEVYYPLHVCNFSYLKPNQNVTNPSCFIESGPLDEDPKLQVEFVNSTTWKSDASDKNLRFNLQQALFHIPTGTLCTIVCELHSAGLPPIKTHTRKPINEPTVFLSTTYIPYICNPGDCPHEILREAASNLTNDLKTPDMKLRIEPMDITYNGSSQHIIFRARKHLSWKWPAAEIAKNPVLAGDLKFLAWMEKRVAERASKATPAAPAARPRPLVHSVLSGRACAGDERWPATRADGVARPRGGCGGDGGGGCDCLRIRRCVADDRRGATWMAEESAEDSEECHHSVYTKMLQNVSQNVKRIPGRAGTAEIKELERIFDNATNSSLSTVDILSVAEIFENVKEPSKLTRECIKSATNVVSKLLFLNDGNREVKSLKYMQEKAETSNTLLQALDNILWKAPLNSEKELVVKEKLTTLVTDIETNNKASLPGGLAIMNQNERNFNRKQIEQLPHNTSLQWLSEQDISAAVLLPNTLISSLGNGSHRLALSVFWDSTLFGGETTPTTSGHVLGISVDGKHFQLEDPIILLFKNSNQNLRKDSSSPENNLCGFWDFEANDGKGKWSHAGCILASHHDRNMDVCICTHLTHFGKLLYNTGNNYERPHDSASLSVITLIGCSLSLIGLAGVFLTSILFPEKGTGRWLQLQLCGAQAMLMAALLWDTMSDPEGHSVICLMRGLLLHWSVLALGIWTLAAALYQHRRLTQPLHALHTNPRFLPIASTLSWGLPVIVCFSLAISSSKAYIPPSCYPFGIELFITVVLPLGCIVVSNSIIFSLIIWSICNCSPNSPKLRESQNNNVRTFRKIIASAYLFCLLGLCWLFGFLQWEYLFCITASLQGISHFVFCVVLDRATRRSWKLYKKKRQLQLSSFKSWTHTSLLQRSH